MAIRIRLMSWNIQKKETAVPYIARVIRNYNIDICALLEVPNPSSHKIPAAIIGELNNLPYKQDEPREVLLRRALLDTHTWKHTCVDVAGESVVYIWHEAPAPSANAFKSCPYTNSATAIKGPVFKNAAGENIYFPTTGFNWNSLPGKPQGRRPAYCTFESYDGAAVRRFTFLDFHTPFNKDTSIQSYATHLYASSREITQVETLDAAFACEQAKAAAVDHLQLIVDPRIPGTVAAGQKVRSKVVEATSEEIIRQLKAGARLEDALKAGVTTGVRAAVDEFTLPAPGAMTTTLATELAEAAAVVGAMAGVYLVASICLATAPPGATASVAAAATNAGDAAIANTSYEPPGKKSTVAIKSAISTAANDAASDAINPFEFPPLPIAHVNCAIIGGDFNVDYPDTTTYLESQKAKLGGGNAYSALTTLISPQQASITAKTTRIGPTAFESQRIYRLRSPNTIQNTHKGNANYVPLDVSSLTGVDLLGRYAWIQSLRELAKAQDVQWSELEGKYATEIYNAFESTSRINDTTFYRANAYDNIFVKGARVHSCGVIDVFSELGSWPAYTVANPQPALAPNPWLAASRKLNEWASTELSKPGAVVSYSYYPGPVDYTITPILDDAEQAAVFFDKYVSDHLPVYVEVEI